MATQPLETQEQTEAVDRIASLVEDAHNISTHEAPGESSPGGFSMFKKIIGMTPFAKPLAVVIEFFESCGITMKQLQSLASGKASGQDLDKTITPIVYKTVPALQSALEHLESEHAAGQTGGAFMVIRNVRSKSGRISPYVFLCTQNARGQNQVFDHFPYFKAASYILSTMEKHQQAKPLNSPDKSSPQPNSDEQNA